MQFSKKLLVTLLSGMLLFVACGENTTSENINNTDSTTTDSIKRQEIEDEMSKEIIEGAFDVLNR